jgi:ribosomal-protein-serine acetyltransferase
MSVTLEALRASDARIIWELVENNREQLEEFLYWAPAVKGLADTRQYLDERINSGEPGSQWYRIIFNQTVVGVIGVKSVCPETLEAEVGFWLCQSAQGRGVATQAISIVRESLSSTNAKALRFCCLELNQASIAVAKRAGATHVLTKPSYISVGGQVQDLYVYRLGL